MRSPLLFLVTVEVQNHWDRAETHAEVLEESNKDLLRQRDDLLRQLSDEKKRRLELQDEFERISKNEQKDIHEMDSAVDTGTAGSEEDLNELSADEEPDDSYGIDRAGQEEWGELMKTNTFEACFLGAESNGQNVSRAAADLMEHVSNISTSLEYFPQMNARILHELDKSGHGRELRKFLSVMQKATDRAVRIASQILELLDQNSDVTAKLKNLFRLKYLDWHVKSLRTAGQHEVLVRLFKNQLAAQKGAYEDVLDQYGSQCEMNSELEQKVETLQKELEETRSTIDSSKVDSLERRNAELVKELGGLRSQFDNVTKQIARARSVLPPSSVTSKSSDPPPAKAASETPAEQVAEATPEQAAPAEGEENTPGPTPAKAKGKGKKGPGPPPAKAASETPAEQEAEATPEQAAPAEGEENTPGPTPAKAKGKGKKGPGPPPAKAASETPAEQEAEATPEQAAPAEGEENTPGPTPAKAKGKGKKGPGPPPAKAASETPAEQVAEATPEQAAPAEGEENTPGPTPAKAKGKGKKGPGPPPAKAASETPAEQVAEATPEQAAPAEGEENTPGPTPAKAKGKGKKGPGLPPSKGSAPELADQSQQEGGGVTPSPSKGGKAGAPPKGGPKGKGKGSKLALPDIDPGPAPPKDLVGKKFHWTNVVGNRFAGSMFERLVEHLNASAKPPEEENDELERASKTLRVKLDVGMLTNFFFKRKDEAETVPEVKESKKKTVAQCLSVPRSQAIEIFLNGCGINISHVKSAVLDLNETALNVRNLELKANKRMAHLPEVFDYSNIFNFNNF